MLYLANKKGANPCALNPTKFFIHLAAKELFTNPCTPFAAIYGFALFGDAGSFGAT
jgi:hypothetical protein